MPDTVYTGQQVTITNTSTGGSTWYWSFCATNTLSDPVGVNIGNPGSLLYVATYLTLVKDGGNCYSFISCMGDRSVIRYKHGSSFSHNPVAMTSLGGSGLLGDSILGIKICHDNGQWIGFVNNNNRIVRLNFGASLDNTPTATLLGPYSLLYSAHCIDIIQENGVWIGFITCQSGNKLVRLDFGNSLLNAPVLTNLGLPGSMYQPGTFRIYQGNGMRYMLVSNYGNNTFTRLSFGNSFLNTPAGVNLGEPCPGISPGGFVLAPACEGATGFELNYSAGTPDQIWRLTFPSGITGPVTGNSLGNIGSMNQPVQFSELIREGDTLILYNTNRVDFTLTRLQFLPCSNASVRASTLFNPPSYSYNKAGTYTVQLIMDEGLATQSVVCKNIVVIDPSSNPVIAFNAPDTVCSGQDITITNTSTGGSTWYWSFCQDSPLPDPVGENIGNPGNLLGVPVYITLVKDEGICYSFITDHGAHRLIRCNHGGSFSNNPVSAVDLGDFGMLTNEVLGIKICNDNGQWIGFVNNNNRIIRLNFGSSMANTPTAMQLGPYPMLSTSHCIEILKEDSIWIGLITCETNNKLVRLSFGTSLLNTPVLTDLGAPGQLDMPGSFGIINENGNWYALVANDGNSTVSRLSFGSSLLNNPTGDNLGIICQVTVPGDIALLRDCDRTTGFMINYSTSSPDLLWRMEFPSGITGPIIGTSLGNVGAMDRPSHFSELFRVGDTLFLYNSNHQNATITRLRILQCPNAPVPSSTLFDPPSFTYSQPGTYNIRLTMDEGMPNQANLCKKIVVMDKPSSKVIDTTLCYGTPWYAGGAWQSTGGTYYDTIPGPGDCDTIVTTTLTYRPEIPLDLGMDTIIIPNTFIILQTGVTNATYLWQDSSYESVYVANKPGIYWVMVTKDGCTERDSIIITGEDSPLIFPNAFTPNGDGTNDTFHPYGCDVASFHILIFNRWGEEVYESDEKDPGWNGRTGGKECAESVYFFIATYRLAFSPGETYHVRGSVTLLR